MTRYNDPGWARRRGRTLLEMILVICAGMAIIAGGLMLFLQAQASLQTYQMTNAVTGMVADLQKVAADEGYFRIGTSMVIQRGIFDEFMISGDRIVSPLGTEIEVVTPPPFNSFTVILHDLPGPACRKILGSDNTMLGDELGAVSLSANDIIIPVKQAHAGVCRPEGGNRLAITYR